jgi:uncharacterized GH25 family protein
MTPRRIFTTTLLTLIVALVVSAHDTWLAPRRVNVKPKTHVLFDLTSGMAFPSLETSIKPDRVDAAGCRLLNKFAELTKRMNAPKSLVFVGTFNDPGIATCWIELNPRQLELNDKQVDEYFDEIDASQSVRDVWKNMKAPKRWREVYVKHAKTFIYVGDPGGDQSWSEPVNMALEIVPVKNPAALRVGDELPIRVLRKSNSVPNLRVNLLLAGQRHGDFQTTDSEGRASFRIKRAGRYLIRATDLRPSTKPDLEWESDFTTLTVEIK